MNLTSRSRPQKIDAPSILFSRIFDAPWLDLHVISDALWVSLQDFRCTRVVSVPNVDVLDEGQCIDFDCPQKIKMSRFNKAYTVDFFWDSQKKLSMAWTWGSALILYVKFFGVLLLFFHPKKIKP